uniref:Uncharacterized protein n=1 Tax=Oryza brachyantha TaxID=4533 RepID=J3N2Q0_ORYBR
RFVACIFSQVVTLNQNNHALRPSLQRKCKANLNDLNPINACTYGCISKIEMNGNRKSLRNYIYIPQKYWRKTTYILQAIHAYFLCCCLEIPLYFFYICLIKSVLLTILLRLFINSFTNIDTISLFFLMFMFTNQNSNFLP